MDKIAIAIHGGAGHDSLFIQENQQDYEKELKIAILEGYAFLKAGGNALDAVIAAVKVLENHPLFNAGRGSALNIQGNVEMDAAIMDGKELKAGAVALVNNVKNPIELAFAVMTKTNHVFLAGKDADIFATEMGLITKEPSYFITDYQQEELAKLEKQGHEILLKKRNKGTVGAVALDVDGNIAAATSTGGIAGKLPGRIGDSCIIGAGCYADNNTCAVSGTGDGEFLITGVIAHSIAMAVELKGLSLQEACDYIIQEKNKNIPADLGVISVNAQGEIGISFNSERMHRAWIDGSGVLKCRIYA